MAAVTASAPAARVPDRGRPGVRARWPTCSPSTTTRCSPPTSRTRRASRRAAARARSPRRPRAALGAPGVLRLGDHRRRRRELVAGIAELLPAADGDADAPGRGHRVQGRARPGGREDRLRPHVRRDRAHPRPAALRRRRRGEGHRDQRLRRRRRRPARRGRGRADRAALRASPTCASATRSARRRRRRHGDRSSRRRPWRPSSCPRRPADAAPCASRSTSSPSRTR